MGKLPKYITTQPSTKEKGRKGEEKVKSTINSGALFFDKADLKMSDYLIEVKTIPEGKKSFRITKKLIDKIRDEAYTVKKEPLIALVFPEYTLYIRVYTHLQKLK